jgi:hypothetical protein
MTYPGRTTASDVDVSIAPAEWRQVALWKGKLAC